MAYLARVLGLLGIVVTVQMTVSTAHVTPQIKANMVNIATNEVTK